MLFGTPLWPTPGHFVFKVRPDSVAGTAWMLVYVNTIYVCNAWKELSYVA